MHFTKSKSDIKIAKKKLSNARLAIISVDTLVKKSTVLERSQKIRVNNLRWLIHEFQFNIWNER